MTISNDHFLCQAKIYDIIAGFDCFLKMRNAIFSVCLSKWQAKVVIFLEILDEIALKSSDQNEEQTLKNPDKFYFARVFLPNIFLKFG